MSSRVRKSAIRDLTATIREGVIALRRGERTRLEVEGAVSLTRTALSTRLCLGFLRYSSREFRPCDRPSAKGRPSRRSASPTSRRDAIAMTRATHPADPLSPDIAGTERPKPVPPHPYRLMADVDAAFEQQVLDVAQRQPEANLHHHYKPDHFRRRVKVAKRAIWLAQARHRINLYPLPQRMVHLV